MEYKDLVIPRLNTNDEKVTIENLRFKNLDYVESGDILYTVATSKSIEDYPVDFSGYIVYFIENGDEVEIGKSAGMIFSKKEDAEQKLMEVNIMTRKVVANASQKAISYAQSIGFDLSLIQKEGIIKVQDIEDYLAANK